jgi:hypothetical protein
MKTALNEVLRVSASFFGLVLLESNVTPSLDATEQNAAPTVSA